MESTALDSKTTTAPTIPVVNHYAPKHQITESIITGKPVTALCGHRYVVNGQGGGSTQSKGSGSVVCPLCADIYYGMPSEGDK